MENHIAPIRRVLFVLCLLPLAHYGLAFWQDALGANPIETLARGLGDWALRFLLVTLAVTPLRRFSGWHWLARLRRMLGLYAFFYASLHLLAYVGLDQFFAWREIGRDILKRPFITAGMTAFLLLVPLAATSSNGMVRRLGGRRWRRLHRLVYPAAALAVLHFTWMVKVDVREPALYGILLAMLLALRLWFRYQDGRKPLLQATFKHRIIPIQPRR
jgi:sulfoxide reductase heme-binding subunit YedZ